MNPTILAYIAGFLDGAGISDYTIVEPREVKRILMSLNPYLRLKKKQVDLALQILERLPLVNGISNLMEVCRLVDGFRNLNYSKKRTVTSESVEQFLKSRNNLAPVETDP